ncbi:TMAO reductase system periplasmic protein TorT [Pigmentibacter sp. JX0631]|uniref:TMAO reductase system periplasmic protein TorT n=1 Tax=Pigmentibacter sp. JX0631 TaxID=2976982 RepID=UPI0024698BE7|nr:TMAO reductase system periplasmic protein TorT [Pigmentibacter sp. JX0631]WGL60480.1 TMAO reductase system periplasmic protein TorT [Pigmentibacter sp. JX0631]
MKILKTILLKILLLNNLQSSALDLTNFPLKITNEKNQISTIFYKRQDPLEDKTKICVLLPNVLDKYWWAVNYGISDESSHLNIEADIFDAGGYDNLEKQKEQFKNCINEKYDVIILAAINSTKLNDDISLAKNEDIPVIDLINGVDSKDITARASLSFFEMGTITAKYLLAELKTQPRKKLKIAWFPGPKDATWVIEADKGFMETLKDYSKNIINAGYGTTDKEAQADLVRNFLLKNPDTNYVVGNAVAADIAAKYFKINKKKAKVLSFYMTESIYEHILSNDVLAAASDFPTVQARISVNLVKEILDMKTKFIQISPFPNMIDKTNIKQIDKSMILPPDDYHYKIKELK